MERVTTSDLHELVSVRSEKCVTLLMPTQISGREGQQDVVRLKNLTKYAEQKLIEGGMRSPDARKYLQPILDIPQDARTWASRQQGLAIFRSHDLFGIFRLAVPLEETAIVDCRFHVKRLLPALYSNPPFFVLAVSRNQVRLLKVTWRGCESIYPANLPNNMEEVLNLQPAADRGEQVHSAMRGGMELGKEAAVFHGQGGHREVLKQEVAEYFQQVEGAVEPVLHGSTCPLILAGVDHEVAIFRNVAHSLQINDEALVGNFDYATDDELCEQARPLVQRTYAKLKRDALGRLIDLAHTGRASYETNKIVPAAHQGQIDTLFVNPQVSEFGRFHPERNWVEFTAARSPGLDLVECATAQTILHRGTVYTAAPRELPDRCALGAIFRY